jgi:hypothetical protein
MVLNSTNGAHNVRCAMSLGVQKLLTCHTSVNLAGILSFDIVRFIAWQNLPRLGIPVLRILLVLTLISPLVSHVNSLLFIDTDLRIRPGCLRHCIRQPGRSHTCLNWYFALLTNTRYYPRSFCWRRFLLQSSGLVSTRNDPSRNLDAFFTGPAIWCDAFWI